MPLGGRHRLGSPGRQVPLTAATRSRIVPEGGLPIMRLLLLGGMVVAIACGADDSNNGNGDGGPKDSGKDTFVGDTSKPVPTCMTGATCDGTTGLCVPIPSCPC